MMETNTKNLTTDELSRTEFQEFMRAILEQNCLREQQVDTIVTKLIEQNIPRTEPLEPTMVPNYKQTVPMFNGESGDTDLATEWINALKTAAILNRWSEICILEAARSHLEDPAKHWYLSHMAELNTYDKFISSFESMFMCAENKTES
jgi:hypothetical protein